MNLYTKLNDFRQIFEEVTEQFSEGYFSVQDLKKQIIRAQSNIDMLINQIQIIQEMVQIRKSRLRNPIDPHPSDFQRQQQIYEKRKKQQRSFKINELIKPNQSIKIQIILANIYCLRRNQNYIHSLQGNKCYKVYLHFHHLDQHISTPILQFSQKYGVKSLAYLSKIEANKQIYLFFQHYLPEKEYHAKISMFQQKIQVFVETEGHLIIGRGNLDLNFAINEKCSQQISQTIQFYEPQMAEVFMIAQCKVKLTIDYLPVKFDNLPKTVLQKINEKPIKQKQKNHKYLDNRSPKKIIKQNEKSRSKSRSPSPINKKIQIKSFVRDQNITLLSVANMRQAKFKIDLSFNTFNNVQPSLQKIMNIANKQVQIENKDNNLTLIVKFQLQDPLIEGFLILGVQNKNYHIKVIPDNEFKFVKHEKSKKIDKINTQNILLLIHPGLWIYPFDKIQIHKNSTIQRVQCNCLTGYYVKSIHKNVVVQSIPFNIIFSVIPKEDGLMVYYKIAKKINKKIICFSVRESTLSDIDVHYFQCESIFPTNIVKKTLNVQQIGFYYLDLASIAREGSNCIITSSKPHILSVVNGRQFVLNKQNEKIKQKNHLILQLNTKIEHQLKLYLFVDDMERFITAVVELKIVKIIPKPKESVQSLIGKKIVLNFGK